MASEAANSESHEKMDPRHEPWVLSVLALAQFANVVDFMIVMPLGPALQKSLHISAGQFGLIVSCYTLAAGVSGFFSALFIDRFDRKKAFLGLYVGFLVGTLLCGLSNGYGTLLAARMLTGAFGGVLGGMANTIVGDVFPESRRGRAMGIVMSAFAVASIVGVPAGIWMGTHWDWRAPFFAIASMGVFAFFAGVWALPSLRTHRAGLADQALDLRSSWERLANIATDPHHLRAYAFMMFIMFGGFAVIPYLSLYLVENVQIGEKNLFWVYVTGGVCALISSPLIGALSDRFGKPRTFWIVAPLGAFVMFSITCLPIAPLWVACAICALLMVLNSGRMVVAMAMVTSCVDPRKRGGFMSVNSSIQHLSMGLGSFVASRILTQNLSGELLHYPIVGLLGLITTLLSLTLVNKIGVPFRKPILSSPDLLMD